MSTASPTHRAASDRPRTADVFAVGDDVLVLTTSGGRGEGQVVAVDSLGVTIKGVGTTIKGVGTTIKGVGVAFMPWHSVGLISKEVSA